MEEDPYAVPEKKGKKKKEAGLLFPLLLTFGIIFVVFILLGAAIVGVGVYWGDQQWHQYDADRHDVQDNATEQQVADHALTLDLEALLQTTRYETGSVGNPKVEESPNIIDTAVLQYYEDRIDHLKNKRVEGQYEYDYTAMVTWVDLFNITITGNDDYWYDENLNVDFSFHPMDRSFFRDTWAWEGKIWVKTDNGSKLYDSAVGLNGTGPFSHSYSKCYLIDMEVRWHEAQRDWRWGHSDRYNQYIVLGPDLTVYMVMAFEDVEDRYMDY